MIIIIKMCVLLLLTWGKVAAEKVEHHPIGWWYELNTSVIHKMHTRVGEAETRVLVNIGHERTLAN